MNIKLLRMHNTLNIIIILRGYKKIYNTEAVNTINCNFLLNYLKNIIDIRYLTYKKSYKSLLKILYCYTY
jgi:hypothetical protein